MLKAIANFPGVVVIGQQNTPSVAPNDTNENVSFNLTIPAGLLGPNDSIAFYGATTQTNNANSKTFKVKVGSTVVATFFGTSAPGSAIGILISNRNSLNAQFVKNLSTVSNTSIQGAVAVDMSQAQTLTFTVQKATAGDTVTTESIHVQLIRAAN